MNETFLNIEAHINFMSYVTYSISVSFSHLLMKLILTGLHLHNLFPQLLQLRVLSILKD